MARGNGGVPDRFSVVGQVVLVSGASRGIGRAIAEGFAQAGAQVLITGRERATLEKTAAADSPSPAPAPVQPGRGGDHAPSSYDQACPPKPWRRGDSSACTRKLILTHFSQKERDTSAFEDEARKIFEPIVAARDFNTVQV